MPAYRRHLVIEVCGDIKAYLKLDVGLLQGTVPNFRQMLQQARDQLRQRNRQLKEAQNLLEQRNQQLGQSRKQSAAATATALANEHAPMGHQQLSYEELYEAHIQARSADVAIGVGPLSFDAIGRMELAVLMQEGLKPTDTLVDLGCGTGRLAVHAISTLSGGRYIGIDISRTMLDEAQMRVERTIQDPPCQVLWIHQTTSVFELDTDSVDMVCAFSVINHMEHEDAYLYLQEALRVVRPGGRFVFSCLPINTARAREDFLKAAEVDLQTRYCRVRNVATSRDFITEIARLAGWAPLRWYDGDEDSIQLSDSGESHNFIQSICVLEAPRNGGSNGASGPTL